MAQADTTFKKLVGQILAERRRAVKLSQEKLAELAGLDRGYISLIERGLRMPTVDTIFRISHALSITPSKLIRNIEKAWNE